MNEKDYIAINKMCLNEFKKEIIFLKEKGKLHITDKYNRNILFWMEDLDKVKYLVDEMKVDYKLLSDNNCSPIFFRNPEVTEFYFKKGLDINSCSNDCFTVLSAASKETSEKLVELGVNINDRYIFHSWIAEKNDNNTSKEWDDFYWKINFLYSKGMNIESVMYILYCDDYKLLKIMHENGYEIPERDLFIVLKTMINNNNKESLDLVYDKYVKGKEVSVFNKIVETQSIEMNMKFINFFREKCLVGDEFYQINNMPWFFTATIHTECLDYFLKNEPSNFFKRDNMGSSIFYYKNEGKSFNNELKELMHLITITPELIFEKNNSDRDFFEVMNLEDKMSFLDYILEALADIREEKNSIKNEVSVFENLLKNVIFKYIEINGLEFLEQYDCKENIFELYAEYQKEIILDSFDGKNINVKIKRL